MRANTDLRPRHYAAAVLDLQAEDRETYLSRVPPEFQSLCREHISHHEMISRYWFNRVIRFKTPGARTMALETVPKRIRPIIEVMVREWEINSGTTEKIA